MASDTLNRPGKAADPTPLSRDCLALAQRVMAAVAVPPITGLYLPALSTDDDYRDEFGFVYLADGTAAPFYVSLADTLARLWRRFPQPERARPDLADCLAGWLAIELDARALALGAFNAVGQHLMRRAGLVCPPRTRDASPAAEAGETVGMVGYFCPVIDQLRARGFEVLVLERQPQRVPQRDGVRCTEAVADLASCGRVLCTASTLINDSLTTILAHVGDNARVEIIGPSGSGLPDVLFARGVAALGGVAFDDSAALADALAQQQSWGTVGRKYELTPADYPGVDALLSAARSKI